MPIAETVALVAGLMGVSGTSLAQNVQELLKASRKRQQLAASVSRIQKATQIAERGLLVDLLEAYYRRKLSSGIQLYERRVDGARILSTVTTTSTWHSLRAPLSRQAEMNRLSCTLEDVPPPTVSMDERAIASMLVFAEEHGIRVWNAAIYRLVRFSVQGDRLDLTFGLDDFLRHYTTFGQLNLEAIQALIDTDFSIEKVLANTARYLPLRDRLLPRLDGLTDAASRICIGGVCVVVAMARQLPHDDFAIPIQRRSTAVSEGYSMLGTIPMAYHQPMSHPQAELSVELTVFRELYEELFGGEEAEGKTRRLCHDWFLRDCEPLQWLYKNPSSYTLECTGFGFNAVGGNYELALLLTINDVSFWEQFSHMLRTNWEVRGNEEPLESSLDKQRLSSLLQRRDWAGSALVAFAEGMKRLAVKYPNRVRLPSMD